MKINQQSHKEIRFILMVFILIAMLMISSKLNSLYQINAMKKTTNDIFDYPFKVSNASLAVQSEVYKIHRDMKDVVLSESDKELQKLIDEVNEHEQHVYTYLTIIRESINDEKGKQLEQKTRELFREWKPIRDEVIRLIKNKQRAEAIAITKGKGANQVSKIENSASNLHLYAKNKATNYKYYSDSMHMQFENNSILIGIVLLLLLLLIAYYTITRISNYILKTEHLSDVLSVVRDVNQLIVREKNKEKLVQEICNILVSNRIYGNAWIALYDDSKHIEYVVSADNSENFVNMKTKLEKGWIPPCIQKTGDPDEGHLLIHNTKQSCPECPFADLYESKGAFSIELKFNDKVYGNLTLSVNTEYLKNKEELSLLHEVAGDISYALYNLETEKHLIEHECSLVHIKDLYENIIDSVDNIIFVKDADFTYIVCNEAFEKFVGKSRKEIIGKSDYEIFDKSLADFFREHDVKMFAENKSKSNFEWVTYPEGKQVYLLTVKSPLHDSEGNLLGLVGNSVDVTEEKLAQEALFESEERFKLIMQQSPSIIELYDLNGLQVEVNHAYEVLWGFPAKHTLHTFNLFKSEEVKRTGLIDYIQQAYAGDTVTVPPYEFDSTGRTEADGVGRKRWLNTRIYPLKDMAGNVKNIVITHEDITEKRAVFQQLEQKKKELETILEEAPNPIMLHNEAGEVLMVNKVWEKLTGYSYAEINTIDKWTKKACNRKSPLNRHNIDELYSIEEKIDLGENVITSKEGNEMIWQISSAPLGSINGKRTIVTSAMDITELKKKDELMMAQSRHAAMGEMIGMIAHQWRQPISGIAMDANNMLLDIAFESLNNTSAEGYAKDILDQTQHLSKTIDDFRNFFKPDKSVSSVRLEDIMNETLGIVKESLINNSIALKTVYTSENVVNAYPRELMQVFVNIINNAKDALLSNHTQDALISINIYDEKHYVTTDICDNGGGIDEAILPKVFDPYFSTKDEKTGTGLGLYMSKMIIEEHLQGCIEASNNQEGGACFKVRLLKKNDRASSQEMEQER